MKVIMVGTSSGEWGGITTAVNNLMAGGLSDKCDLTYISATCSGNKVKKLIRAIASLSRFTRIVGKHDIAHVHMGGGNSYFRERYFLNIALKKNVKTVLHLHDGLFHLLYENRLDEKGRESIRSLFKHLDTVIVLSDAWKQYIHNNLSRSIKVEVIPNSITLDNLPASNGDLSKVLFLGHLNENKHPERLIEAVSKCMNEGFKIEAHFGADGDVEKFSNHARALNVEDRCYFHGWIAGEKKNALLMECGIYCLTSDNEGMPMALLETMGSGLVPVVSPISGISEVISDGYNGIEVEDFSSNAFSEKVMWLISNPEKARFLAENARNTIFEDYNIDKSIKRILSTYNDILD